ncbi:F-box domain-containing protein [Mycena sanguinolenta]|uniref:F-box domain-containing protein n=1 Tax=Mycena sanguinolenta TaxID=230812 RepID=A0A8H7DGB5_9AGAR|nr:F-box domain-containing protein [Mycena sanguinolenta]
MHPEALPVNEASGDILYPFESRIPVDILELIFEAGVRIAQRELLAPRKPIETVVSHINRRWRDTAVNLAVVWSFIQASSYEPLDKLQTYLTRSKNHTLSIRFFAYRAYWTPEILGRMRPHLHRIRQFHLITDFFCSSPTLSSQFQPFDMPKLECFLYTPLDFAEFESPPPASPLLPFTTGAPLLKSIRINGPMLGLIRPPFSGISQLCLTEERFPISLRSICEILQSCTALVKFSFTGHTQRPHRRLGTMNDIVPFVVPELRYLLLCHGGNSDVILSAMTAPKLCSLRLNNFDEGDLAYFLQWPLPSPKFPVLESLSFLDNTFPIDVYRDTARAFPTIRSFSCFNSSYTDDVLEFLVPLPTSVGFTHMPWPNLSSFAFSQAQFHEKHQKMLCTLVSARIALRTPILNLFLGYTNRLLLDTERLEWLREQLRVDESREMPEDDEMSLLAEFSSDYSRPARW